MINGRSRFPVGRLRGFSVNVIGVLVFGVLKCGIELVFLYLKAVVRAVKKSAPVNFEPGSFQALYV